MRKTRNAKIQLSKLINKTKQNFTKQAASVKINLNLEI